MTWQHRVIFNHCELKWSDLYFPNFISLITLNWWWNKPTYGSAALWTQPWLFLLFPTFLSFITLHCRNAALWTQPRLTKIFHHDGPTAAFNIHLGLSFGVGSQWQLKLDQFTWLTSFIAMGPRPHSTSIWKCRLQFRIRAHDLFWFSLRHTATFKNHNSISYAHDGESPHDVIMYITLLLTQSLT